MQPLSVFITTFNNARTIGWCLDSVSWADEIVVLDSFSDDETLEIARQKGCRVEQQVFAGYSAQKQAALDLTTHRWVLLLDSDEMLSESAITGIRQVLEDGPDQAGYELPRIEQMFWQMQSPRSRLNYFLRLFDKTRGRISDMPVHEVPIVDGPVGRIEGPFLHFSEIDIQTKVDKVNRFSTLLVEDKLRKGQRSERLRMILAPPFAFVRAYLLKRQFFNGWAGFIASVTGAFYVFLKYAKLYEHRRREEMGKQDPSRLPPE
jgi:glycosyltransferase involved in cell wall biosynthesis